MKAENRLKKFISVFCDIVLGRYSEKFKMILNVLYHDWKRYPPNMIMCDTDSILSISDKEINEYFHNLGSDSVDQIHRFLQSRRIFTIQPENICYFYYNYECMFTREELKLYHPFKLLYKKLQKKYPIGAGEESLLFHHGLVYLPPSVIQYLKQGIFIDAGACCGDSSFIFSFFYKPQKILAFEPSEINGKRYEDNMREYNNGTAEYELIPLGLGDKSEVLYFCSDGTSVFRSTSKKTDNQVRICRLDDYIETEHYSNIKLIKADLEGMGLSMLKGSELTIKKNRPVLLLSIYHNREEFLEIYRTLQEWDLHYEFRIRSMTFPLMFTEMTLLGYPAELTQQDSIKWNESWADDLQKKAEILLGKKYH